MLIEGNDPRLIDLAVLSRLPLGAVISWQHRVHHFGDDQPGGKEHNDARRGRQAEIVADIVAARTRPDSSYLICGDLPFQAVRPAGHL